LIPFNQKDANNRGIESKGAAIVPYNEEDLSNILFNYYKVLEELKTHKKLHKIPPKKISEIWANGIPENNKNPYLISWNNLVKRKRRR